METLAEHDFSAIYPKAFFRRCSPVLLLTTQTASLVLHHALGDSCGVNPRGGFNIGRAVPTQFTLPSLHTLRDAWGR